MTDKYDFMCIVDDIFKECGTIGDLNFRFIEMQNVLTNLFNQNCLFSLFSLYCPKQKSIINHLKMTFPFFIMNHWSKCQWS